MLPVRRRSAWTLSAAAALAIAFAGTVSAQAPAPATNPQIAAAQASFEALPEAERKAIQADLIWAGGFTGAASGSFGALTFRAINTFKSGLRWPRQRRRRAMQPASGSSPTTRPG